MSVNPASSATSNKLTFPDKPDTTKAQPETAQQITKDSIKASTQLETKLKGTEADSSQALIDESKKITAGQASDLHASPIPTVNGSGQRVGSYLNIIA